jgi:hypothetical protein
MHLGAIQSTDAIQPHNLDRPALKRPWLLAEPQIDAVRIPLAKTHLKHEPRQTPDLASGQAPLNEEIRSLEQ